MDPLTATLTFVSLSASLVTLLAAVGDASKTLFELQRKIKDAPRSAERLQQDLRTIKALLDVIKAQSLEYEGLDVPQPLQHLWSSFVLQLESDVRDFKAKISTSKFPRKGLKARIGHVFSAGIINEFQNRYSAHIQTLIMVQSIVDGQRLALVSASSARILDETITLSQAIRPRIMSRNFHNLAGLRTRQHALAQGDPNLGSCCGRDGIVTTRTNIALEKRHHGTKIPITSMENPQRTSKSYIFPMGKLLVHYKKLHLCSVSPENDECGVTEVDVVFIPPYFISNTMIRARMKYSRSSTCCPPGPTYSLNPVSVNQDPELRDALNWCNVPKLKNLFLTGRARPTDMILGHGSEHAVTLLEATLEKFVFRVPYSYYLSQHKMLLDFLLDRASIPSDQALIVFLASMNRSWSCDHRQNLDRVFEAYFRSIIAHHESSLEDIYVRSSRFFPEWILPNHTEDMKYDICNGEIKMSILPALLEGGFGFDVVPDIILHYSQPWVVEDLGSGSIWYVGILAYSDRTFFRILRSCLCSERSEPKVSDANVAEDILHSVFGIDAVVSQVLDASVKERSRFIRTLIGKGTTSMLEPFVDAGLNLDEGSIWQNYLSLAAELGKLDFFNMLVDAGANCARAIPQFCNHSGELEDPLFKSLLSILLDRATADAGYTFDSEFYGSDALRSFLISDRAMDVQPDGPAILLKKGIVNRGKVVGRVDTFAHFNYAVEAIRCNRPAALKLLLEHGTPWDVPIGEIHPINRYWHGLLYNYTLLTWAVELGHIACVDTVLKHAHNPTNSIVHPDGRGQSALQLAISAAAAPHPRDTVLKSMQRGPAVAGEASAFQDTSVLALLQDALLAEHNNITTASEKAEMIRITESGNLARHNSFSRLPLVATIANSFIFSHIVTFCGYALCFLADFLPYTVLFLLRPWLNDSFSWINGHYHPCESYQRCKRCGKTHHTYYITRHIIRFMWAQLKQMSISESILVAMGYFAMYAIIVAHNTLEFGLSLTAGGRVHYRSARYYVVLGAAIIWALAILWRKE